MSPVRYQSEERLRDSLTVSGWSGSEAHFTSTGDNNTLPVHLHSHLGFENSLPPQLLVITPGGGGGGAGKGGGCVCQQADKEERASRWVFLGSVRCSGSGGSLH